MNRQIYEWECERQAWRVEATYSPQARIGRLLMPKGSTRERLFLGLIAAARRVKRGGPGALFKKEEKALNPPAGFPQPSPKTAEDLELLKKVVAAAPYALNTFQQYEVSNYYAATTQENRGPCYVPDTPPSEPIKDLLKLIAFYLPQYHPIAENDAWWGRGFTEWNNVTRAIPQYLGHYQPHLPIDMGFYDLRIQAVQERQVELAKNYGINGFAFYYYWFAGKRLLEKPLDSFLENENIDFPFCLIWANENWTRRWDGKEDDVIMAQVHSPESDVQFIQDIAKYLRHPTYIKIDGRPVLIVYKVQLLPDAAETAKRWREYCVQNGLGNPYLIAAQTMGFEDPRPAGFDAAMQFPPHNEHMKPPYFLYHWEGKGPAVLHTQFEGGGIFNLPAIIEKKLEDRDPPPYKLFETAFPMWDNTARRPNNGWIYAYATPELYRLWLTRLCNKALERSNPSERIVFLNAWNEWAEGAHLEPDRRFGYAFLKATRDARNIAERGANAAAFVQALNVPADEKLAKQLESPPVNPTFVYQMGKVGSMSIVTELENRGIGLPVIHSHMLNDLDCIADNAVKQYPNPIDVMYEVQRGKMIREWMAKAGPETKWNVITMTREPVGRNISAFFQNIEQLIPNVEARIAIGDLHVDELHELFLHIFNSKAPEHWFDGQLKPIFGVDVYSQPYDFAKGYAILDSASSAIPQYPDTAIPRASASTLDRQSPTPDSLPSTLNAQPSTLESRVLVIRMEDLDRSATPAMAEFMNVADFKTRRENRADQKYYSRLVALFKARPIPDEYLDAMYSTQYSRHFYTPDEVAGFRARWQQRP